MRYRERNEWWIGSKRFKMTHECVCVQLRFARAVRSYLVGLREKGRILFEQTSYIAYIYMFALQNWIVQSPNLIFKKWLSPLSKFFINFTGKTEVKTKKSPAFGYELRQSVVNEHHNMAINWMLIAMTVIKRHVYSVKSRHFVWTVTSY